jgi:hypothetical protein
MTKALSVGVVGSGEGFANRSHMVFYLRRIHGFQHCAIVRKRREEEFRAMAELITWFMEGDVEPQTAKQC